MSNPLQMEIHSDMLVAKNTQHGLYVYMSTADVTYLFQVIEDAFSWDIVSYQTDFFIKSSYVSSICIMLQYQLASHVYVATGCIHARKINPT